MLIYKIFRPQEWAGFEAAGQTLGAPIDLTDGFIHFSTATQAAETAAKHFAGIEDLKLVAADADRFGDALKWEVSRGGALFPHLYGALKRADVVWVCDLPLGAQGHIFPDDMA